MNKRRVVLSLFSSLAISLLLLWFLRQSWPPDIGARLRGAWAWFPFFVYGGLALVSTLLRAWRYRVLLAPVVAPFFVVFLITLVRNFTVDLLPMRAGSLSVPALFHYRLRVPWRFAWGAYLWSIVWDFVSLALFLWLAWFALVRLHPGVAWLWVLPAALTVGVVALLLLPDEILLWFTRTVFRIRNRPWGRPLARALQRRRNLVRGLKAVAGSRTRLEMLRVGLPSVFIRALKYVSLYVLYVHFLGRLEPGVPAMGMATFIWTMTFAEMTAGLPVQGFMNIGPWEVAWSEASHWLARYQRSLSALLSPLLHWTTQIWEYAIGGMALGLLVLPWGRKSFRNGSRA